MTGPAPCGVIYATTGARYTTLARRAARALREVWPEVPVDLFTDQDIADEVFDAVHPVGHAGVRPKIAAMRDSRFDRTLYLDADTFVLRPVPELFDLLERADIAASIGFNRTPTMLAGDVPRSAPLFNSGVVAVRKSPATRQLLEDWEADRKAAGEVVDQAALRRQLWARSDLRVLPLGDEYNLKMIRRIDGWAVTMGAPRILHQSALTKAAPGDPQTPLTLREVLGPVRERHILALLASDWTLGGDGATVVTPDARRRNDLRRLRRQAGTRGGLMRRLRDRIAAGLGLRDR